jgi:hypothetical protein
MGLSLSYVRILSDPNIGCSLVAKRAEPHPNEQTMAGEILADSSFNHIIEAPIELIDIPAWLYSLPTEEYRRCSPQHIAAGATFADDGKRMSINVEMIGGSLLVQNYVEQVGERIM